MKEVNYIYYNAGNYMSLINSLNEINFKAHIIKDPKDIIQNLPIMELKFLIQIIKDF